MHDEDLHDSDADTDSLPLPGWVATGRGYTREVALESVGAGWAALIHFLFDRIERRRDHVGRPAPALPVRVTQVKEKFGGLRFYYNWPSSSGDDAEHVETFEQAVSFAEHLSFYLCEQCGAHGRPRTSGWVRTLCDTHAGSTDAPRAP